MTSHLLTDGFVSGNYFFLSSPSFFLLLSPFRFSDRNKAKKKMLLYLGRVGFLWGFFFFKKKSVGSGSPSTRWRRQQQHQRRRQRRRSSDAGPCGSSTSRSRSRRLGERKSVPPRSSRGLLQCERIGQNLRPGGTSAGSCGYRKQTRERGGGKELRREQGERHWQTTEWERG